MSADAATLVEVLRDASERVVRGDELLEVQLSVAPDHR